MTRADLWRRIYVMPSGCWEWRGIVLASTGYGQIDVEQPGIGRGKRGSGACPKRKKALIHRVIYTMLVGEIPEGLTIDHLCRVRHCVNPGHMEVVSIKENTLRGIGPAAQNARKTHCLRGHPLEGYNLMIRGHDGARQCRVCRQLKHFRRADQWKWSLKYDAL